MIATLRFGDMSQETAEFPASIIASICYDTPSLRFLREKPALG